MTNHYTNGVIHYKIFSEAGIPADATFFTHYQSNI